MTFTFLISKGLRLYFNEPATASDLTFFQNFVFIPEYSVLMLSLHRYYCY